jgi:hypothetical protein
MFHKVKVFSPEGQIKKVVSSNELSAMHWKHFSDAENNVSLVSTGRASVPKLVKSHLDLKYSSYTPNPS